MLVGLMVGSDVLDGIVRDLAEGSASSTKARRICEDTLRDSKKMGATMELPALSQARSAGNDGQYPGNIDRADV